jgi:alpha-1,6-mannosyltransferase
MRTVAAEAGLREGRPWMTNAALCVIGVGLMLMAKQFSTQLDHFTIGFSGLSGWSVWLYLAAIVVVLTQPVNRVTYWIIIGFAIAFRAFPYFAEPFLSSDIYRYVWDGVVQHAHINPYRYVPGDPALAFLRAPNQDLFDNMNRRDYARTIYPPVAQMVYYAVTFFSPTVAAMKMAMIGFECVTVGALLALLRHLGRPREEVLLYAWCPLLVWEIGNSGHVDAAVFAFVTLALLFRLRGNAVLVGVFLGAAILTKFYPAVLFPALYQRRDWKMPAVVVAMVAASYGMYSSVGRLVFGFLGGYEKEEGMKTGARYFLLEFVQQLHALRNVPVAAFFAFCAVVMGGLTLWAWWRASVETFDWKNGPVRRTPEFLRVSMLLAFALMLLFSPHYPWYIAWLVPMLVLVPNVPLLAYVCVFFYMCTTPLADGTLPKLLVLNEILYASIAVVLQVAVSKWPVREWFARERLRGEA